MKLLVSSFALFSSVFLVMSQFPLYNKPIETPTEVNQMVDSFMQSVPSLPRYMEGGYSPLGRSPVVDTLLADPLYMPTYAEIVSELIKNHSQHNHLFSLGTSLLTAGGIPTAPLSKEERLRFHGEVPDRFLELFPSATAKKIYSYWSAFVDIHHQVEDVLKVLSKEEKTWIKENYNGFFFASQDSDAEYDFFSTESPYPLKFFELASRIDLAKLADCARKLSLISDDFYQSREEFGKILLEEDFIWEEHDLKFIVSQKNHTVHQENADFFIDLGGYNTIRTNAGGTEGALLHNNPHR